MASLLLSVSAIAADGEPPRVAVSVSGSHAEPWQSVLTAELGKLAGLQIVERAEYGRVLREREELALRADGQRQLPPLAGIAFYLHFREMNNGRWLMELVNAADGRLAGSSEAAAADVGDAARLSAAAQKLLAAAAKKSAKRAARIAVVEPAGKSANDQVFILAARLRDALTVSGFTVLDRALTQEVVIERNEAERGLRDAAPASAFLGADYFLQLAPAAGERCELRLVNAADNHLAAAQTFPFDGPALINKIQPWLLPLLGAPERAAQPYLPSVSVEALQPFYRGLKLYDEGKFAGATNEFNHAYMLDRQFKEAYEWEARCYDELGMGEIGDAARRYSEIMPNYYRVQALTVTDDDTVSFLGVSGGAAELGATLSVLAANALADGRKVTLPESLAQICRERDWLAGVADADGHRWEQSPSLFCHATVSRQLAVEKQRPVVTWLCRDTISGKILDTATLTLTAKPADWPGQIKEFLQRWPSAQHAMKGKKRSLTVAQNISIAELENKLRQSRGFDTNIALINLALADPGNPMAASYGFEKADGKRQGIDGFLNTALRNYCIRKLPKGHPQRRWLELMQIYQYLGGNPIGKLYSGKKLNYDELLQNFIADNDRDIPSLLARYSLLLNTQGRIDYPELIRQYQNLLADIKQADTRDFPDLSRVAKYTESNLRLAQIADGDTTVEPWTDFGGDSPCPRSISLAWRKNQKRPALDNFTPWITGEFNLCPTMSGEEKIKEAQVAILMNGRGDFRAIVPDAWLEKYPRSLLLTTWLSGSVIHEVGYSLGLPIQHRFDGRAELASYSKQINYAADGLKYWLGRVEKPEAFRSFERYAYEFIMTLNENVWRDFYSDRQFYALQKELAATVEKNRRRLGSDAGYQPQSSDFIAWQNVTREQARRQAELRLYNTIREIRDCEASRRRIAAAERAAVADPQRFNPEAWWNILRSDEIYWAFSDKEVAQFYLKLYAPSLRLFDAADLSAQEINFLFEEALLLMSGGHFAEAETIFGKILNIPATDLNRTHASATVKANALFRLAQIFRMNGRLPEAVQFAQEALQICGQSGGTLNLITYRYENDWESYNTEHGVSGDLSQQLVWLLQNLRFNPDQAALPERVGVVSVPTPNVVNPVVRIFYRVPPDADGQPRQVLVLSPGYNVDPAVYFAPDSPWSKFADAHQLVLVMPQFWADAFIWRRESSFAYFSSAQIWPGQALLDGLDKINERAAIKKKELLFNAYGSGCGFAFRFARWKPELVAVIAANRPSNWSSPRFAEYGLQPLSALKQARFYISNSEVDNDHCYAMISQAESAVHFATLLQGHGVSVAWKTYPELTLPPIQQMEADSRDFLAEQLRTVAKFKQPDKK